ncbi:hypothetical protein [Streptomyces sp. 769]|uniref:hypothetical protein n=1 Tax=Streptomyces sp. 769 TaxID=1262452 RepID=UPI00057F3BE3|nr:hypothetical protein [Streptomyces sp. 769]AJC53963.1 hypothetical protein GZL_01363 [Streptomyces sp. 769]
MKLLKKKRRKTLLDEIQSMTRRERVLIILKSKEWVSSHELAHELVGGTGFSTRLSELRRAGHTIESRLRNNNSSDLVYEYRLLRNGA